MNADADRAAGYKHGMSYLCRNCEELITVHNHLWEHCSGDWMEEKCTGMDTLAQPTPWGVLQLFEETLHDL